ncbi:MAG: FliH/SctL family protein [Myxococcota bacterium]
MTRVAYKPPPASAESAATPAARPGLSGLPRQTRQPGRNAYLPPGPDGDQVGPTPAELLAVAQAEVAKEAARVAKREQEIDALAERYASGLAGIAEAVERAERVLARDAISVGMLVAEQLLGRALAEDGKAIVDVVRNALREVPDDADTQVRVSADDLPRVELALAGTKRAAVEFVADPNLDPGDCIVESPGLVVDARLRERLSAIGSALAESVPEEARLPTHDEVSLDERSTSLDEPLAGGPVAEASEPTPDAADTISIDDAGPDAISLEDPTC